jgi:hypothetical protein
MKSKIISFQIVQGYLGDSQRDGWSPEVIALCEDGSLWMKPLSDRYSHKGWTRITEPFDPARSTTLVDGKTEYCP